jgi:spore maturation protein SpmB
MKLSKLFHVLSVLLGLTGLVLWAVAILAMPAGVVRFGQTREVMLFCAILSLLAAIWLVIGAMHHATLEKRGEIV